MTLSLLSFAAFTMPGCGPSRSTATVSQPSELGPSALMTLMFFGMSSEDGGGVSEQEWQSFVAGVLSPRFPGGVTVFDASGHWRLTGGSQVRESTRVVFLIHEDDEAEWKAIDEIAAEYRGRFRQQAVLRATSPVQIAP